jgi:hypothetical protein
LVQVAPEAAFKETVAGVMVGKALGGKKAISKGVDYFAKPSPAPRAIFGRSEGQSHAI